MINIKKTIFQKIKIMNEHSASLLLLLLLTADFAFVVLHIIYWFSHYQSNPALVLHSPLLSISKDGGYAELYQYVKFFWIVILFSYVAIKSKSSDYISWILIFAYCLLDDSLKLHERVGGYVANSISFNIPFNLRPQDIGELAVSVIIGTFLLANLIRSYLYGSHIFKKVSKEILLLLAALVFFGVFVDMVHSAIHLGKDTVSKVVNQGLVIVEDGGEMLVVSLVVWYVFLLAMRINNGNIINSFQEGKVLS